jgi:hypothetical protein
MSLLGGVTGKGSVSSSGGSSSASGSVPGSSDLIVNAGGYQIDPSFLDSLYNGGKLSAAAREALLESSDPRVYGLNQYDLYYLTGGQFGSKLSATSAVSVITDYSAITVYAQGTIVRYQPTGSLTAGLYQASVGSVPAGTLPTNTAYWIVLIAAGPVVLYNADVLNPTLAAVSAPGSGILGVQKADNSALASLTIPVGKRYKVVWDGEITPVIAGQDLPTDHYLRVVALLDETANADGTTGLVITPRWSQTSHTANTAIAAVTANTLRQRLRVEVM